MIVFLKNFAGLSSTVGNSACWVNRDSAVVPCKGVAMRINPSAFSGDRAVQKITGIKLQARLGRTTLP